MPVLLLVINNVNFLYSHRLPLALAAVEQGYDVHVATCFNLQDTLQHNDKLTYHYIHFNRNSTNPFRDLKACYQLAKLYKKLQPSIIHHVGMKPILYGSVVAKLTTNIPYVNAISGLGYVFINNSLKARCVRQLVLMGFRFGFDSNRCYVIFQNKDDHEVFVKNKLIGSNDVSFIQGSGVDLALFSPNYKVHEKLIIVFPARLLRDKGISEFVRAARLLKNDQLRFVLVGDVDPLNPTSMLVDTIQQWVAEGVVEHWGWRDDMESVFQQADIACLPSYREGMPKSLLEAAACGLPIVTTDAPGCRDVVEHGVNGFLVPIKNIDLLVEHLQRLIDSPSLREQMGGASRERAEQLFGIKKIVEQHLALYECILKSLKKRS